MPAPLSAIDRTTWLAALPVAAAIVERSNGALAVRARNALFAIVGDADAEAALLQRIEPRIAAVLAGRSEGARFPWRQGGLIDGRHFTIVAAPLGDAALVSLIDRTTEVQTERSLRGEMLTDSLTGLPNRAGFVEALEARIADDGADYYGVVVVDLARFSRVNECIGSLGGDELIITAARRLMSAMRGRDVLGRTGSNEFALVVRIADGPGDILHVARRIAGAFERPCRLSDYEIKVDCSIGCALADGEHADAERLMRHAQAALKAAKGSGRTELYQPRVLAAARRRFSLETELRRAIEDDALRLAFQPLIRLSTGRVAGFEALARWDCPGRGIVPPSEFIAVAEDSGLIVPLGRWALDRALAILAGWDVQAGHPLPFYVAVNLSAIQVARDDIAGLVTGALAAHGLPGARLMIELTESAIVADPERAARALDALKACDALVAMDDFGTGYSNLASLQKLPIDTLKIDRSFVSGMMGDGDKLAIVRAILGLAQALGMTTTAEGIETPELAATLAALGCTTGQGFFYAAPMDADAALDFAVKSFG